MHAKQPKENAKNINTCAFARASFIFTHVHILYYHHPCSTFKNLIELIDNNICSAFNSIQLSFKLDVESYFLFRKKILYTKEVHDKNKRIVENSSKPKILYAKVVKDKNKRVANN